VEGVQKIIELKERTNNDDAAFNEQANRLMDKWKKTRPISIAEVKKDNTLLHNTIDRGTVYWN
jgi:hypothetical protein